MPKLLLPDVLDEQVHVFLEKTIIIIVVLRQPA